MIGIKSIKKNTAVFGGGQRGGLDPKAINTVVVRDSDGSCGHAITIVDGWIFDSNEDHALPLCDASLNYITTSEDRTSKFMNIEKGYAFFINFAIMKKRKGNNPKQGKAKKTRKDKK